MTEMSSCCLTTLTAEAAYTQIVDIIPSSQQIPSSYSLILRNYLYFIKMYIAECFPQILHKGVVFELECASESPWQLIKNAFSPVPSQRILT